jgi:hypothetical protein
MMPRVKNPRVLLAVGFAVAALVVVVVLAVGGSGEDDAEPLRTTRAPLTLERYTLPDTGATELLISLREQGLNTPERTGGATSVALRCSSADGTVKFRTRTMWPLLEETGYPFPHIHQPAGRKLLRSIRACRLTGPGIDFEGTVPGPPPPAAL